MIDNYYREKKHAESAFIWELSGLQSTDSASIQKRCLSTNNSGGFGLVGYNEARLVFYAVFFFFISNLTTLQTSCDGRLFSFFHSGNAMWEPHSTMCRAEPADENHTPRTQTSVRLRCLREGGWKIAWRHISSQQRNTLWPNENRNAVQ